MDTSHVAIIMWSAFGLFIVTMLLLDLGVFNRKSHVLSLREAAIWSGVWVALALTFNLIVYFTMGLEKAGEFLAGYLIEESLSVDNLFVFIIIFKYFGVSPQQQPRVLKWGILGALIMRGLMIATGVVLIERFHWMTYVFGLLLLFTVMKMILMKDDTFNPGDNWLLRVLRRFVPVTSKYHNERFFIRKGGRLLATPLLLVVVVVESSDLIFALDSIPAIFAVTHDPFIVYTSNIFAVMGLRALYFLLAGLAEYFHYLKPGIILILLFVAIKMLIVEFYKIPISYSLFVIGAVLAVSIVASVISKRREEAALARQREIPPNGHMQTRAEARNKATAENSLH